MRLKCCATFFFICILCNTYASLQLNSQNQIVNLEIGGKFQPMVFNMSEDIFFDITHRTESSYDAGPFVFDTVYVGAETYSVQINSDADINSTSLGWYASNNPFITIMGQEIFPFRHKKMLLGSGIEVSSLYDGQATLVLPNETSIKIHVMFLFNSESIFIPYTLIPALDRTVSNLYSIPYLDLTVSTTESHNAFTLQGWNESYVGIGMAIHNHGLAITYERGFRRTVWGAYDENINYSPEIQLFIVFLSLYALIWYLFLLTIDANSYRNNNEHYELRSILMSYSGTILAVGTVLRELIVYDLYTRMQYVTGTRIYELGLLVISAMGVIAMIHIYTTYNIQMPIELRRASFDTLLALAIASIFVGRTEVREETVLCFVIASMWTPFQLMSVVRCPGWGRLILLLQFMLIYPLMTIVLVEPLIATVPELETVTWPASQLIMFLPPLLLLGLWTVLPQQPL